MADNTTSATAEELRGVLAAAGACGAWDWDIAGDTLIVDPRFAELYGLDPQDAGRALPTATFYQAIHAEDRARIRIAVAGLLAGAELFSKEFRVIAPNGAILWMHGRGQGHRDEDDNAVRFTGLLIDVTDRKRTEERLRVAQSAGGVGTFEYQDGFATVSVSSEFCRLLGFHPTDRLPVRTINAVLLDGESPLIPPDGETPASLDGEFRIHRSDDGAERWIARRGEVIQDGEAGGYRLLGVVYDVTEAKRQEARLRDLNDTLEQRVAEEIVERLRTEEALRQSQKMEAVGQLTGGIAHDFNNLLTIVSGSVEMASRRLDRSSDPRVARALDNAMRGVERAAALTQRLLAFSRRQPLDPRAVDAPRLLAGMSDLLTRTITESIAIAIDAPDDVWTIEADPHQLENAILNLGVNARDAMPRGGQLTISARNRTIAAGEATESHVPPGDYVAIAVADSGIGMAPETITKVFDPFFTTKEVGKGTGLGLSMVYGFVKQSGGAVDIVSTVDAGTTVTLLLARSSAAVEAIDDRQSDDEPQGSSSETLLVVEDDDDVRAYTVATLRELGYRVIEAHDGASALRLLERQEQGVQLLVTDVVMPAMSGSELAQAARALVPDLLVLYTSGYPRDAITRDGRLSPGVDLLAKPFTFKGLAIKVRELLDRA
ncbi:hybrid sensor histidine kinase/response regulator [Sphingomonas montanisoli]|uniref:histidine kinase n=1 Tax=Sphingomonas montanisoli TaxID=2606412 RepID=A0A5D9C9X2_9SPHN|nr:hybrid sensor histidine kinase/response regulator [Sphingomonas montanisoli]TZG28718.1 PAS domain-containing protein [Sphingomonas montanisoli]